MSIAIDPVGPHTCLEPRVPCVILFPTSLVVLQVLQLLTIYLRISHIIFGHVDRMNNAVEIRMSVMKLYQRKVYLLYYINI